MQERQSHLRRGDGLMSSFIIFYAPFIVIVLSIIIGFRVALYDQSVYNRKD